MPQASGIFVSMSLRQFTMTVEWMCYMTYTADAYGGIGDVNMYSP